MSKKRHKKIRKKGLPPGSLIYTGHREENPALVQTVRFSPDQYAEHQGYAQAPAQPGELVWIDVRGLTDTAMVERVGSDFELHPLVLEDVLNTQQRAKLEEYDNGLFFIVHHLRLDTEPLELNSEQIAVFIGQQFVISFQEDPDDTLLTVRKRIQEGVGRLRKKGSDYLAYAILDTIVDNYYLVLDEIENTLLEIEGTLNDADSAEPVSKARIFELKHIINNFRHRVMPLRDAAARFYRTDCPFVDDSNRLYLRDLMDHVTQILDSIDNYREILSGVESLYQAEISNRLNNVMRLLTIISTIFIPLSFIAGLYGMNFDNMPELHWHLGYFFVLGSMLLASLSMLYYFRRNKWL
jgi:magnesium transporter